jgi:hypothetical protein
MAISVKSSGTVTTDGTEQVLLSTVSPGSYVVIVDVTANASGDQIEIAIKKKVLTAGTVREQIRWSLQNAQASLIFESIAVSCPFGLDVTIKKVAGTNRDYPWSVVQLDS